MNLPNFPLLPDLRSRSGRSPVRSLFRRGGAALIGLAVFAYALTAAHAQTVSIDDGSGAYTRGLYIPDGARSGEAQATAIELNPAQLSFLRAGAFTALANVWSRDVRAPGRGAGVYWAGPLGGGSALGLSLQDIAGSSLGLPNNRVKFQLAYGVGGRFFALGANWSHLWGDTVGGVDTFDVGASLRLMTRAAIGVVVEDASRPTLPVSTLFPVATSLPRRWIGEVTLRPFGTDVLNLAVASAHIAGTSWSQPSWRFRASAALNAGWRLFADLDVGSRHDAVGTVGEGRYRQGTLGLAFDVGHATVTIAPRRAGVPAGDVGAGSGATIAWNHSGELSPDGRTDEVVRLNVEHLDSDRRFVDFILGMRDLAADPGVVGVLLKVDDLDVGIGRVEELRDAVAELRARGKKVIAVASGPSMRELYLASACDRIVIHPAGMLTFAGVAQSVSFYKTAMDRLGVGVDLVRIAEYKGAMEPYVFNEPSEPVKRNRNDLIDDVFHRMIEQITLGRRWEGPRRAPAYVEQLLAKATFTPYEARDAGLVDAVMDDREQEDARREWFGSDVSVRDADPSDVRPRRWMRSRVAVLLIDGAITDGGSKQLPLGLGTTAGEDSIVAALERCRTDGSIRAVVLRINSPGGSAYSSDVIARAVTRLRAAGKPVVASMGDVAASGGYYVAAPTDVIFAEPSTTTGSIGIYGFKVDVSRLLTTLGIHIETYRRGEHADQLSSYRPWTDTERTIAAQKIRYLYELFVKTVAEGRRSKGLTAARVNDIGRGHVWTGAQAKANGLVDEFGGLTAAVTRAMQLSGLKEGPGESPEFLILPRPSGGLVDRLAGGAQVAADAFADTKSDRIETETDALSSLLRSPAMRSALKWVAPYLWGPSEGVDARLPSDWQQ